MINIPRFKHHFHVQILPPDKVFLLSESGYHTLSAASCAAVAELIDGKRSADEIVNILADRVSTTQAYYVLSHLEKKQYIEEATNHYTSSFLGFWNALGVDSRAAARNLATTRVTVTSFGNVPTQQFLDALAALDVQVVGNDNDAVNLAIALADDYLQQGLKEFNVKTMHSETPWLLAKPNGLYTWIGPIFTPGQTGCWECLSQRLRANREIDSFLCQIDSKSEPYVTLPSMPTTIQASLNLIATEVAKWIVVGKNDQLSGKIITINQAKLELQEHTLIRRPQCPSCGDPGLQARLYGPVVLQSCHKGYITDGGHRAEPPERTLRKFEHHVSPITGVVNKLVRISDADDSLQHVYVSGANMAVRHMNYDLLRSTLRSRTAGKGQTDIQAKVSAIGEAIERYSGAFRGDEPRITASFRSLGDQAVDPRSCLLFSETQYRERDKWLALDSPFMRVPLPFDEHAEIEWTPLWSLTHKTTRYLPMEQCFYAYPIRFEQHFTLPDSNGCAAGSTIEEAVFQGFLELVERDSMCLWWYNRVQRPALDLDSFNEPYIQALLAFHKSIRRDLWVLDLTSDLGIPTFVAISRRNDKPLEDIVFAPAAHLDPRIALLRAVTELNQLISAVIDVDKEGYTFDDPHSVNWWKTATLENQPHFISSPVLPARRLESFTLGWSNDILDDIQMCQSIVEMRGLEMLVLNQTRPDIDMKVVKVVVPGLRHFWARFAPGRLYDVPVKLGWLRTPLSEQELNPTPIFI